MPETHAVEAVASRGTGTASQRGTVYIVQSTDEQMKRYRAAEHYGDLVPIIQSRDAFPDDADHRIGQWREVMKTILGAFNPAKDYVLLTGDPLAIALCILVLSISTLTIPCLKWDRDEQAYYPVVVSV